MKCTIISQPELKKKGFGGITAVDKGSIDPPTFTIAEYKPANAANSKPIVLVGKGVTFDSGISLKPPGNMDEMKFDMCGAATVFGLMEAL